MLIDFDDAYTIRTLRKHLFDILGCVGFGKEADIVFDEMIDGTAIALEDHHAAVVGFFADGLGVARVAEFASIDNFHFALHAAKAFQSQW